MSSVSPAAHNSDTQESAASPPAEVPPAAPPGRPRREGNDSLWKRARRTLGTSSLTFLQPQSRPPPGMNASMVAFITQTQPTNSLVGKDYANNPFWSRREIRKWVHCWHGASSAKQTERASQARSKASSCLMRTMPRASVRASVIPHWLTVHDVEPIGSVLKITSKPWNPRWCGSEVRKQI